MDYRSISIMGSIAKMVDDIMATKLADNYIHLVINVQLGFFRDTWTTTNRMLYSDYENARLKSLRIDWNSITSYCFESTLPNSIGLQKFVHWRAIDMKRFQSPS